MGEWKYNDFMRLLFNNFRRDVTCYGSTLEGTIETGGNVFKIDELINSFVQTAVQA